ncbi:MAG: glycosyltransferase family 9 protein [Pseudomonadota bacterium]
MTSYTQDNHGIVQNQSQWQLARPLRALYMPPFPQQIPLDLRPIAHKPGISLLWRRLRPWLMLGLSRQLELQRERIPQRPQRILWIYKGTPQVGDALMDLSSRVLLRGLPIQLELLTDANLAHLFAADDVFAAVHADGAQLHATDYDLIILDSFKARCLQEKQNHFPRLPFVTMRGYFSGPEFNRTLFSFYRMKQLLDADREADPALLKPHLLSAPQDRARAAQLPIAPGAVAFAIGGAVANRAYEKWDTVIADLLAHGKLQQAVLVGSDNATAIAERVVINGPRAGRIVNCVAQYSLLETLEIMKRCSLAVCCDGGLLHLANSAGLPTLALFDSKIVPDMRMTSANRYVALQSTGIIDDLPAAQVTDAIAETLAHYSSVAKPVA